MSHPLDLDGPDRFADSGDVDHVDDAPEELDPRRVRSRDRLLDAATELLTTGGIEAVTIEAVTRRSKVARTTLYRNFGNSAGLLTAVLERLVPPVEPVPQTGTVREQLTELLARKAAALERAPVQWTLFAWAGPGANTPTSSDPEAASPAARALRERVIEHYRQPFDDILRSPAARAELGDLDPTFVVAQLFGPAFFLYLTGLRAVTPADCARIVNGFLAAHCRG